MTISPDRPAGRNTAQQVARIVAAGLGSGWLPKAPGTWGSLLSLPVGCALLWAAGVQGLLLATLLITMLGCAICAVILPDLADADPGWIVIDEWAGQWLTLALVVQFSGPSLLNIVLSFAAFRLFDILKPFPIRRIEHLGPAWWSIMADDLLAGLMAGCSVLIGYLAWASFS